MRFSQSPNDLPLLRIPGLDTFKRPNHVEHLPHCIRHSEIFAGEIGRVNSN